MIFGIDSKTDLDSVHLWFIIYGSFISIQSMNYGYFRFYTYKLASFLRKVSNGIIRDLQIGQVEIIRLKIDFEIYQIRV